MTTPSPQTPLAARAISPKIATSLADTLKALADPLRLRLVSAIAATSNGDCCVCDLTAIADVSQPTVSHHLKKLKDAELLTSERRGTWVHYQIAPARRAEVMALLSAVTPLEEAVDAENETARVEALRTMDARVTRLAEQLAAELSDLHPDVIMTIVRESYAGLARTATVTQHLIPLTERFARQRLADLVRDRAVAPPQVLFVCVGNSGRSQLAAALTNQLSGGRVIARSAGSRPAASIDPDVRVLLQDIAGDDVDALYPKPLTDDAVRAADVVVTMGCGDVCPVIPGVNYEDWAVGDPALASPEGTAAIRDDIAAHVRTLLDTLLVPQATEITGKVPS
ncbi:metalloregulator ArsR/SmtB family transcription factor [Leucobacter insecticola]|uniref:Metalloregulator ArsR/SmtB family transcription factor n=1 Tax=Leucobacter insecticola TaxID=2714934 RepID=A0A6G8FID1_9MICO|nr:metalloregulator ArsR/SmtB family transcription factor [Leucobacter insecticola]QIM16127.1 metalloregulator ArsR/SmtB family transcription factor [Leucobacter insecticola]